MFHMCDSFHTPWTPTQPEYCGRYCICHCMRAMGVLRGPVFHCGYVTPMQECVREFLSFRLLSYLSDEYTSMLDAGRSVSAVG